MQATVDMSDVLGGLNALKAKGMDLRPVWRGMRPLVTADLKDHFARGEGPSSGWPYLAPSTIARRMQNKGMRRRRGRARGTATAKALRRLEPGKLLGRLKSAWRFTLSPAALEARSEVPWADLHQLGGRGAHGARIPARPFAWVSDRMVEGVGDAIRDYVVQAW
jgi:phage gpG-like protein